MVLASLSLCVASPAAAKEGVVARLTEPVAAAPSGGVSVEFVLESREDGRRFGASGVFVRARLLDGRVLEVDAVGRGFGTGEYAARVPTRPSQIADLTIGLAGIVSSPEGVKRSDRIFRILNEPFPPGVEPSGAASGADDGPSLFAVGAFVVIALALGLVGFRLIARSPLRFRRAAR
jgi:hypothetical protein